MSEKEMELSTLLGLALMAQNALRQAPHFTHEHREPIADVIELLSERLIKTTNSLAEMNRLFP